MFQNACYSWVAAYWALAVIHHTRSRPEFPKPGPGSGPASALRRRVAFEFRMCAKWFRAVFCFLFPPTHPDVVFGPRSSSLALAGRFVVAPVSRGDVVTSRDARDYGLAHGQWRRSEPPPHRECGEFRPSPRGRFYAKALPSTTTSDHWDRLVGGGTC